MAVARRYGRRRGRLGALTAVVLAAALLAGCGLLFDDEDDLTTGDCVEELPTFSGESIDVVDCDQGTYFVLWNAEASGDEYPGDIATLEDSCLAASGGTPSSPSRESWEEGGDRNVICLSLDQDSYTGDGVPPEEQPGG
jgi:hypothetical protein